MTEIYSKTWDILGFLILLFVAALLLKGLTIVQLKKESLLLQNELLLLQIEKIKTNER